MSKVLVFQHVAHEILGTLNPLLKHHGFRIRYVNFDRDPACQLDLDSYQGLVVLGGPMNVDQVGEYPHLDYEVDMIRQAIQQDMPVLGICLGAQLVAKALGAVVKPNPIKEIGWYEVNPTAAGRQDPLLSALDAKGKIFQWHGDTFDIPEGAVHLATSQSCRHQAFRYQDKVYGFQFHLEVDQLMIERWLEVPLNKRELATLKGTIDPQQIRRETEHHIQQLTQLSDRVFGKFIELFAKRKKYRRLPSR